MRDTRKILNAICYIIVVVALLVVLAGNLNKKASSIALSDTETTETTIAVETAVIETITECIESSYVEPEETPTIETTSIEPEPVSPFTTEDLGEFTITYYCSCGICCDGYAYGRPVVDGKEIVFTATGAVAQQGVTVAVDPTKIPYGTVLYIEGIGYRIAQDCGGAIKNNKIDVYVNNHAIALENGMRTAQVYAMNELNS